MVIVTQFEISDNGIVETGHKEIYHADTIDDAKTMFCYAHRLSNGNLSIREGPTGKVLYTPGFGWAFKEI